MTHSPTPTELLALKTANAALLNSPDSFCDMVATIVFALGSAQLLQSPETAAELRASGTAAEHHVERAEKLGRQLQAVRAERNAAERARDRYRSAWRSARERAAGHWEAATWVRDERDGARVDTPAETGELARLRARVAELEALMPARYQTCRECGTGYEYGKPCSTCEFHARIAAAQAERTQHSHLSRDLPEMPHA